MGENACFKNGHARVETRILKTLAFVGRLQTFVDSVSVRFTNTGVKKYVY